MDYQLITSNEALAEACQRAQQCKAVALDTEFVRTRTLKPHLGLIQLFDGQQLVLIDPLDITDFSPFILLLENQDVVKILHSCSEDLETFLAAFGVIPFPVFDTQFAASVLGLGASIGYAKLIEELCGVVLDKGESRTDWLARPLSENQLAYAANDVLYLLPAYEQLNGMIHGREKRNWIFAEIQTLAEKKRASMPLEYAYLLIKNNWRLNSRQLTVLQHLAAWRLNRARDKDIALNFVFKEPHLFEAAQQLPEDKKALNRVHGISPQTMRMHGEAIVNIVNQALEEFNQMSPAEHLPRVKRLIDFPEYKKYLAAIKEISSKIAVEQGVSEEILASKKQINQVLKWWWFEIDETKAMGLQPDLLNGWRKPLFQPMLENLLGPVKQYHRPLQKAAE
ncbi:ribonuclease D [Alteromonas pelagimontana]|uniref:Ribonuclease D n=1 Tax=Alteromonas pelagimontana TaxID=1858656 RepID=A0A6M4MGL5_9ALTE|nr:ribonuclease D [Alteromonas pelagimontana]QJR82202.1 ribonuclease D [Alteromonas pelagimontana]